MSKDRLDVAIIDYKMGNMFSVQSACKHVGLNSEITFNKERILNARSAILPGVGAFGKAMTHLERFGLTYVIKEFIGSGRPFMGICLGMQLLFSESEEFGVNRGINILEGTVRKFPDKDRWGNKLKVPQIGWNRVMLANKKSNKCISNLIFDGIKDGEYFYFVHSFYVVPSDGRNVLTVTNYEGIEFCSSAVCENVFVSQFHPERSAKQGLRIYKNFVERIKNSGP